MNTGAFCTHLSMYDDKVGEWFESHLHEQALVSCASAGLSMFESLSRGAYSPSEEREQAERTSELLGR